jgi:RecA-family ATPase
MTEPDIRRLIAEEQGKHKQEKSKRGPAPLKAVDALAVYDVEYPPSIFVVDGLLPIGLTLVAGRPKVGKSWFALQIALALAFGERALGRFRVATPGKVTYLALEESQQRTNRRLRTILGKSDPRLQNIHLLYEIQPLMTGGAAQLDAFLTANPSELVIIDTLLAFVSAHSGRRDVLRGDYAEVNVLRQLAEKHGNAILAVAHSRKAAGDMVDSIIGTSGTTAACDSVWRLQRMNTGEASLEVKGRELEEAVYGLKFNTATPFGWQVTSEGQEVGLSEQRREILLVLQQEGARKPADIARLLGNKNINTVRRLIQKLAQDGIIMRQRNGTYAPSSGVECREWSE